MKNIGSHFLNQDGSVLLYAVFTLVFLGMAGATLVNVSASDYEMTSNATDLAKAEYEALAGLEWAKWKLSRGESPVTMGSTLGTPVLARSVGDAALGSAVSQVPGPQTFAGGSFEVSYDETTGIVTSVGKFGLALADHSMESSLPGEIVTSICLPPRCVTPPTGPDLGTPVFDPPPPDEYTPPDRNPPNGDALDVAASLQGVNIDETVAQSYGNPGMGGFDHTVVTGTIDGGTQEGTWDTGPIDTGTYLRSE